jgi:hypothetical protein
MDDSDAFPVRDVLNFGEVYRGSETPECVAYCRGFLVKIVAFLFNTGIDRCYYGRKCGEHSFIVV